MENFIKRKLNNDEQIIINDGTEVNYKRPSVSLFSLDEQNFNKDNYINLIEGIKSKSDFIETKSIFLGQTKNNENIYSTIDELGNILVVGNEKERENFLNTLLTNISLEYLPNELRFALIGPSSERYAQFKRHPLMFFKNPIPDLIASASLLDYLLEEINKRSDYFDRLSVKSYNEYMKMPEVINRELPTIPKLVLILEEYIDFGEDEEIEVTPEHLVSLCEKSNNVGIVIILTASNITKGTFPDNLRDLFKTKISYNLQDKEKNEIIFSKFCEEDIVNNGNVLIESNNNFKKIYSSYITQNDFKKINDYLKNFSKNDFHSDIECYIYGKFTQTMGIYDIFNLCYYGIMWTKLCSGNLLIDNNDVPIKDLMTITMKILFVFRDATVSMIKDILKISESKICAILRMLEKCNYIKLVDGEPKKILISYATFKKNVLKYENYDTILMNVAETNYSDKNYEIEIERVYDDIDYKYGYDTDKKLRENVHKVLAQAFKTEIPRRNEIEKELSLDIVDSVIVFSYLEDKLLIIKELNSDRFILRITKEDYNKKYGIEFGIIK